MVNRFVLLINLLLALLVPLSALGFEVSDEPVVDLDQGRISHFRDTSRTLSFSEIEQRFQNNEFESLEGNLTAGYSPHVYWLNFRLVQPGEQPVNRTLELLPAYFDQVELFQILPDGGLVTQLQGDFLPLAAKENAYRTNLFNLKLEPGEHQFFIRL